MRAYPMQAVSTAAYKAFQKSHLSRDKNNALFFEALSGKELILGEYGFVPVQDFPPEQTMG